MKVAEFETNMGWHNCGERATLKYDNPRFKEHIRINLRDVPLKSVGERITKDGGESEVPWFLQDCEC